MIIRLLWFLFLPSTLLSSPQQLSITTDDEESINNSQTSNYTQLMEFTGSNYTEMKEYNVFDNYYPLLLMLISLPENDTMSLANYLNQQTYAELKKMIDDKQKDSDIASVLDSLEKNNTDLSSFVSIEDNKIYMDLVEAYHNASIYSAIRGVWNTKLNPILPSIDQLAILEYFAERKSSEQLQMSIWARLWAAIRAWLTGIKETQGCNADRPQCLRKVVETLPMESRIELERAVDEEDAEKLENIIEDELRYFPSDARNEFLLWRKENEPPETLQQIVDSTSEVEKIALDRLRRNELIHSLKDYYRAVIEARSIQEQEELRHFFQRMNDSFARCFNPIRQELYS